MLALNPKTSLFKKREDTEEKCVNEGGGRFGSVQPYAMEPWGHQKLEETR